MTRLLIAPVLCLAAAAALSCATPGLAQTAESVPTVSVKYGDLDVGSRTGAQALLKRIETAAGAVCGGAPDIRQLSQLASFQTCRRSAVARAVVAVDLPMLTALAHGGLPGSFASR